MTQLKSYFSVAVADRIKAGASVFDAIRDVVGGMDGRIGRPKTTDILDDLETLDVWHPEPIE